MAGPSGVAALHCIRRREPAPIELHRALPARANPRPAGVPEVLTSITASGTSLYWAAVRRDHRWCPASVRRPASARKCLTTARELRLDSRAHDVAQLEDA